MQWGKCHLSAGKMSGWVVMVVFLFAGCQPGHDGTDPGGGTTGFTELSSPLSRDNAPALPQGDLEQLRAGNTAFALDLYRYLKESRENLFFSPHSISVAMAMTYAGAAGSTAACMADTMNFTLPGGRLHAAFNFLDLELARRDKDNERLELHIVNALWGQRDFPFLQVFLDLLAVNYGAGLNILDFISDAENARAIINNWVAEQTNQRITGLLPPGSITGLTRLVLTNAMYFKAPWAIPFVPEQTVDEPFNLLNGGQVDVPMMRLSVGTGEENEQTRIGFFAGYSAVELPYVKDQVSMLLIVPDSGRFVEIEAGLDDGLLQQTVTMLQAAEIRLEMPRFQCDCTFSLKEALSSLGMEQAFSNAADFSGMTGGFDLFIDNLFHKSFINVDEAGTEAAAATAVNMSLTAVPEELYVKVDRPFIYLIRDVQTGAVLFLGRVLNPQSE